MSILTPKMMLAPQENHPLPPTSLLFHPNSDHERCYDSYVQYLSLYQVSGGFRGVSRKCSSGVLKYRHKILTVPPCIPDHAPNLSFMKTQ